MIYVIRHGQTDLNKEGRLQGRNGLPLNGQGIKQAESLRGELKGVSFDYVFSSPQERAVHTAEIATGVTPAIDPRLDVFDLGTADRMKKEDVQMKEAIPDPDVYEGVEDIPSYMKRVFSFMEELENKYGTSDVNILISGHRCTTGCIGSYFEGIPEDRNILKLSSDNGGYKGYSFKSRVNN
ncbi:histidine phosphatase family protein [Pseudalkalibacillus sp. Hm43]|uniref:histidine phosphatase family protein n=1 Tax=Pseudalkalibacillus sp. Hm43 TaxID=3450742 RepID=UPI003F42151D